MLIEAFPKTVKMNERQNNDSAEGAAYCLTMNFRTKTLTKLNKTDSYKTERKICITENHQCITVA